MRYFMHAFPLWYSQASRWLVLCIMLFSLAGAILPLEALAQDPEPPASGGSCTSEPVYDVPADGSGILSQVVKEVRDILHDAAEKLFNSIKNSGSFQYAVYAAITLFIAIYGAAFLIGATQLTLGEGVVRLIKIGIIFTLLSPLGWTFFNDYVVKFFDEGTDQLIDVMTSVAVGGVPPQADPAAGGDPVPLRIMDSALQVIFSIKMFITLAALPLTSAYGLLFTILLFMSIGTFLKAVLNAVWVYLMSLVAKTLLFGLAPIFLSFMLFSRTKHLFDGWVNQLVNYSLQPLLLFAFLGFYVVLIKSSLQNILGVQLCWTPFHKIFGTAGWEIHFWRFVKDGFQYTGDWPWKPANPGDEVFPINIVDVLIFLLLAQLAWRYTQVVVTIAREISGSTIYLTSLHGALSGWFSGLQNRSVAAGRAFIHGQASSAGPAGVGGFKGVSMAMRAGPPKG